MHWATPLVIAWVIEISTLIILIQGIFFILKSSRKLEKGFRKSFNSILFTLIIFVLLGIFMGILVTIEVSYSSLLWIIPPILGFFGALVLVRGGKELFEEISKS